MVDLAQGGERTFWAEFKTAEGALVDPVEPLVDVVDLNGNLVEQDAVPARESLGRYSYLVVLPAVAPLGQWEVVWSGVVNGLEVESSEAFMVVAPAQISASSPLVEDVRELTSESPTGDFPDSRIETLLSRFAGDVYRVVLHIWRAKAAKYARHIDLNESGSNRSFSQLHKNALAEVDRYQKLVDANLAVTGAAVARTVGRSFAYLDAPAVPAVGCVLYGPGTVRG